MSLLNQPAPDIELVDLETGDTESLSDVIKRTELPTIVLFYATWSRACVDEVQLFEAWSKEDHHLHANFILINVDQNVGESLAFLSQINPQTGKPRVCVDYRDGDTPTILHFGCVDVPEPYCVQHVPHRVVIDEHGIVRRNGEDFHWDDVAGLLSHRSQSHQAQTTQTFLFPSEQSMLVK